MEIQLVEGSCRVMYVKANVLETLDFSPCDKVQSENVISDGSKSIKYEPCFIFPESGYDARTGRWEHTHRPQKLLISLPLPEVFRSIICNSKLIVVVN